MSFVPVYSTNDICVGEDVTLCLTDKLGNMDTSIDGKASTSHTHTEYAPVNHSHTGFATTSHTHTQSDIANLATSLSGKADATHNHDGAYLSVDGGSLDGDLNVNGVLRVNGNQAFYTNASGSAQTIGTNNATAGTTICCGSSATVTVNGSKMNVPSIVPRATSIYQIGNTSLRFNGIYLVNSPNVSSDKRMKKDIVEMDNKALSDFVNSLNVVGYKYIGDDKDRIGLIAQDVVEADDTLAPYFVEVDEEGYMSMRPSDLVFPLIAAVQKLTKEVEDLKSQLA